MGARKTRLTPLDPKYLEEIGPAKVGRPRFEATQEHREKVKTLAAQGVSQKEIAAILRIDTDTLIRECREDWEMGRAIGIANVQGVNYKRAMSGDHGSFQDRQFYLINVAGMSSGRQQVESVTLEELVRASMKAAGAEDGGGKEATQAG